MPQVRDGGAERVTTIPNLLSIVRIALIPIFLGLLLEEQDLAALAVLALAGFTDLLDGQIARRFDQITELGKVLDPIADRLTIFTAALGLAWRGIVPWWLIAVVLARDAFLLAVGFVLAHHELNPVPTTRVGKLATALLLVALPLLVLAGVVPVLSGALLPIGLAVAAVAALTYWVSAGQYALATARAVAAIRALKRGAGDTPGASVSLNL